MNSLRNLIQKLVFTRARLQSLTAVLRQLLREILLPFLVAVAWTTYNVIDESAPKKSIQSVFNLFGVTLISVSYFFAQLFRIAKQQKVDSGLRKIEIAVDRALTEIEQRTGDVISHVTGGESACYLFGPAPESNRWTGMMLVHVGKHPLYELSVRVCDLDIFEKELASKDGTTNLSKSDHSFFIGNLAVNYARMCDDIVLGDGDSRRFNIFFNARNGATCQELRCRRVNGIWVFATRTRRSDVLLHEIVQPDFPVGIDGAVEW